MWRIGWDCCRNPAFYVNIACTCSSCAKALPYIGYDSGGKQAWQDRNNPSEWSKVLWYAMTVGTTWILPTSQCPVLLFCGYQANFSDLRVFTISSLLCLKASDVGLSSPWIWQSPTWEFRKLPSSVELCQAPRALVAAVRSCFWHPSFSRRSSSTSYLGLGPVSCTIECILSILECTVAYQGF